MAPVCLMSEAPWCPGLSPCTLRPDRLDPKVDWLRGVALGHCSRSLPCHAPLWQFWMFDYKTHSTMVLKLDSKLCILFILTHIAKVLPRTFASVEYLRVPRVRRFFNHNCTNTGYCRSLSFVNLIRKNKSHWCFIWNSSIINKLDILLYGYW